MIDSTNSIAFEAIYRHFLVLVSEKSKLFIMSPFTAQTEADLNQEPAYDECRPEMMLRTAQ